ncbi:hypothetical protein [Kineothrix sedimenti]|uniref:Uncharacterized protein n=1 Tax=Kineothrix sedimenti TaxID=3123317 RepID=A0ABZ3F2J7_9FIRM
MDDSKNDRNCSYSFDDPDLPDAPRLEIYKETFGDLINITDEWYKNNRG